MNLKTMLVVLCGLLLLTSCAETAASTNNETAHVEVAATETAPTDSPSPSASPDPNPESKTELQRISSQVLGYDLQYWVQLPAGYQEGEAYPTLYVTDGWWYKENGGLPQIAEDLMTADQIEDIIIVYVDAYDPDDQDNNRRNSQFLCKPKYVEFYREELVPAVDRNYSTNTSQPSRGMLGVSFGGLNSMYFGIHANDVFGKIGIQSPAPHPCPDIYTAYEKEDLLPIDIFLSTGTINDKAKATRRLKKILEAKSYDFAYQEVPHGHTWANWTPLLDDVLLRFYGTADE